MKRLLTTAFYIVLSIAGLNFFALAGIVGIQAARGKFTMDDAENILRVLGGRQRYVIPSTDFEEFQAFLQNREVFYRELENLRGLPETRVPAALAAAEAIRILNERDANSRKFLADEQERVQEVRREVDAQKTQLVALRKALDEERAKNAIVELDAMTQNLRRMLAALEEDNLAVYLTEIVRDPSRGGEKEAARIMRMHLTPRRQADVLDAIAESDPDVMQRIVPLLENLYAGVPPDAVVVLFRERPSGPVGPAEMRAYLIQMNSEQALGVYLRLDAREREALAPFLLNPPVAR